MNYLLVTYAIYTAAAIALTIGLARTLSHNGAVFLRGMFEDNPEMARAINSLLVIGFYMLNLGYAFLIFRSEGTSSTLEATENLVTKLGLLLASLGVIHFLNMTVFWKIHKAAERKNTYPVAPTTMVTPPPPAADAYPTYLADGAAL